MIDKEKIKSLFISNDFDQVTDIVDKLLSTNKKNSFLLNVRGMVHSQKNEFSDAIRYFEECLLIDSNNDVIYSNLAFSFLSLDNHNKAIENFEKAALINSGSFQYHFQLGDLYYKKGNFSKAIISLEKALALDDSNTQTYINLSACYGEENNERAIVLMEKLISFDPENSSYIRVLSILYLQFKDYENALKYLKSFLNYMPDDPIANHDLGIIYYILNDYSLAVNYFNKSLEIEPDSHLSWLNLGKTYRKQYNYDDSIEVLLWSENLEKDSIATLNELASCYFETNQKELSLEYITKSLSLDSDNLTTLCLKADLLRNEYKFSESETFYKKVIDLDDKFSIAYTGLGLLCSLTDRAEKAISFLNKSIQLNPSDGLPKEILAIVYKKDKNYDLAIDLFKDGKQPSWENNVLECLYYQEKFDIFQDFLENNQSALSFSRQTSAILNHASIHLQNNFKNPYCEKPLNYIKCNDVDQIDGLPNFNKRLIDEFYNCKMDSVGRKQALLFNGTQSTLNIFEEDSDLFDTFKNFISKEAEKYFESYANSNDGLITNRPNKFSLKGWFVDIKKNGFLKPHNHPEGWISGVYYLRIPKKNDKNEANIKFLLLNDDFPESDQVFPEMEIEALESRLILFPSSLYHHTNLFTDDSDRICVSFDFRPLQQ